MNNHGLGIIFEQFTVSISYSTFRMRGMSLNCHYAQRSHISLFAPYRAEKPEYLFRLPCVPKSSFL